MDGQTGTVDSDSGPVDSSHVDSGPGDIGVIDGVDGGVVDGGVDPDSGGSVGCGLAPVHTPGGIQVTIDVGPAGDGNRGFYLSLPTNYEPMRLHKLIFGFSGTNWVGEQIQPYLQLESQAVQPRSDEIFVYPDPLWRDFAGWGNLGGWLLGPHADPADGEQDLVFTQAIIDFMKDNYCIDDERIFATGHSWGGDMAMVVGCFLGDRFRATVPVAANRPYWFETGTGLVTCNGETAVWTMFGIGDDHFTWQGYPGQFGDECRDFWVAEHHCDQTYTDLNIGAAGECVEYNGCSVSTRYCLYDAAYRHQIPHDYFARETMAYFRSY